MPRVRVTRSPAALIVWVCVVGCSVFPDQAVLPGDASMAGAAGAREGGTAGLLPAGGASGAGASDELGAGQMGSSAGTSDGPGAGQAGESGAFGTNAGGEGGAEPLGPSGGGGGGGAGGKGCTPEHVLLVATADSWIDAANPRVNHGTEAELRVLGGANEQRTLLSFALPTPKPGQALRAAILQLTLAHALALGAATRTLSVSALTVSFSETRATWTNFGNGASRKWATPGADFAASSSTASLGSSDTVLRVDLTAQVALAPPPSELGLVVRDAEGLAFAPLVFSFVSREGATAGRPVLDLEYCPP